MDKTNLEESRQETAITILEPTTIDLGKDKPHSVNYQLPNGVKRFYRFTMANVFEHLTDHRLKLNGLDPWCPLECMARSMHGINCSSTRRKVARSTAYIFKHILDKYGHFVVVKYDNHKTGRVLSYRMLQPIVDDFSSDQETQEWVADRHHRLQKRFNLSNEQLLKVQKIIGYLPSAETV